MNQELKELLELEMQSMNIAGTSKISCIGRKIVEAILEYNAVFGFETDGNKTFVTRITGLKDLGAKIKFAASKINEIMQDCFSIQLTATNSKFLQFFLKLLGIK